MARDIEIGDILQVRKNEDQKQQNRLLIERFRIEEQQHVEVIQENSDDLEQERPCLQRMTSGEKRIMREIFDAVCI